MIPPYCCPNQLGIKKMNKSFYDDCKIKFRYAALKNEVSGSKVPDPLKLSQLKTLENVLETYQCPRRKAQLALATS